MKRILLMLLAGSLIVPDASAFCGFFVAKAGSELFNESSQVILVRDGDRSVITMSNDFKGAVRDFAMVVPVPVILKRNQIRTVKQELFNKVDAYSSPRLAEYYDENPCSPRRPYPSSINRESMKMSRAEMSANDGAVDKYKGVTIEAVYAVDEYDIIILSATESTGLKNWLNDNEYAIPEKAEEVLDPYIKSGMNFFVAKVNLERHSSEGFQMLSPLQIEFNSNKFMLPIRLGMANANGDQDLIVHAYTRKGRVECTNYRTVKMPHDVHVPEFVKDDFGAFYKKTFDRMYTKEGGRAVFLEYAWDVSPTVRVKCDPCVGPPPIDQQLATTGINWLSEQNAQVFYTRLHVRYNRKNFPQDLVFQNTPNNDRFQCRYVITHPPIGKLDCKDGQTYLKKLVVDRENELHQLAMLTGADISEHADYVEVYRKMIKGGDDRDGYFPGEINNDEAQTGNAGGAGIIWLIAGGGLVLLLTGQYIRKRMAS